MIPRPDYNPTPHDDDWEDIPAQGWIPMWLGGVGYLIWHVGVLGK